MGDPLAIFGTTFPCDCGKVHRITTDTIQYAEDALARLPETLARVTHFRRVAVLMDARTRIAAGRDVAETLKAADWLVAEVVVPDTAESESPVCDETTKDTLDGVLPAVDIVVPVGAGVINDLGKWLAYERDIPFVAFATAASMNGHASANVAPTINRVKTLVRARPPRAVFSTPAVLREAPFEMTAAGLGDILAKSVSSADWRVNHLLFGDYYCDRTVGLIAEIEPLYLDHPEAIRERRPEALRALFHGLLLTGAAMTMAETSAPSSGGEHLVSHALDMLAMRDGHGHDLHGRQVGLGTILASELYRRLLALDKPSFDKVEESVDTAYWGTLAQEVEAHYRQKHERIYAARDTLRDPAQWDRVRAAVADIVRPPEMLRDCLQRAGAAYRAEDIGCSVCHLKEALLHAHQIRSRFTVLDLAWMAGILPDAADEIAEKWM